MGRQGEEKREKILGTVDSILGSKLSFKRANFLTDLWRQSSGSFGASPARCLGPSPSGGSWGCSAPCRMRRPARRKGKLRNMTGA